MGLSVKQGHFQQMEGVGELWPRGRGEGTFLLLPSSLQKGISGCLQLVWDLGSCSVCPSLPAPQLSLCSQNSSGGGRGEEVVYLRWRWISGIRAMPREGGCAGGVPVPLDLSLTLWGMSACAPRTAPECGAGAEVSQNLHVVMTVQSGEGEGPEYQ